MKSINKISMVVLSTLSILQANEKSFSSSVMTLGTMLNVPFYSTSLIRTSPLFTESNTIVTNGLKFLNQETFEGQDYNLIVSSNDQIVAYGNLIEESTFKNARDELLFSLSNNSMMLEAVAGGLNINTNSIGDFVLLRQNHLYTPLGIIKTNDFSNIHFVRGAKAISLHGKEGRDMRPIAETLDSLIK